MARKSKVSNKTLVILLCVAGGILLTYLGVNKYLTDKKLAANSPTYPDDSAIGVTYNFYQWYTSCLQEEKDENPGGDLSNCYKNTAYLTNDLVKSLDKKQKTILCGKDLNFHTVAVREMNTNGDTSHIEVSNSSSKAVVANTTVQQISGIWKITDISCNQ